MHNRPNIIVFMTDQQRGDTVLPEHICKTPNIDRFRTRAMQFSNAYCPSPHCCPSRATFFSGLYPSEHGVWHNVEVNNAISRTTFDGVEFFPEHLQKAGYETFFSGKWHVSAFDEPQDRGFDHNLYQIISNYGHMSRGYDLHDEDWSHFYSEPASIDGVNEEKHFGRIIRPGYPTYYQFGTNENPFTDNDTVRCAVEAIHAHDGKKPMFMYVGTLGPHDPYIPPQRFLDMYADVEIKLPDNFDDAMLDRPALYRRTREQFRLTREEHIESIRRYLAFCSYEDALFGQILDAVEANNMTENTIIFYLSDHGDTMAEHGLWAKGLPCFRGAYNICALAAGPGIQPGRIDREMISLADFAPTIEDLAGISPKNDFTGRSLLPFLRGERVINWRDAMFTQSNGNEMYGIQRAVWTDEWKYVFNGFDYDELYDLRNDPLEMHNRINAPENAHIVKEMCMRMWSFARAHRDACTCPYIMVGFAPYGPGITIKD